MKKPTRSKYRAEYPIDFIFDYKDPMTLSRFLMEGGKIIPARISKLSMAQQKCLSSSIKRARSLSLLPYGALPSDNFGRVEGISPKPFTI